MKHVNKIIAAAVISGVTLAGASMAVQAKNAKENDAIAVTSAAITLEQAVNVAQQAVAGIPAKAEFSTDEGVAVWEVEIVDNNHQVVDIDIDANSGKVLKQEMDQADHEDDEHDGEDDDDKDDRD